MNPQEYGQQPAQMTVAALANVSQIPVEVPAPVADDNAEAAALEVPESRQRSSPSPR